MRRKNRDNSADSKRGSGGFVTVGVVLTVVGSMMATLFGAGAASRVLNVFDGNVWLWSASKGEVSRVNSASGRVDMRAPITDTRNHRVQVIQTDKNLLLRDLTTGKITSLDLATLGIAGSVATEPGDGITVALHNDSAFIIDSKRGTIRQVDPTKLSLVGKPLTFPSELQGGSFDDEGRLWVAVPSEGTVVRVRPSKNGPTKPETFPVADTDHQVKLTVLDRGAALVDQTKGALFRINEENVKTIDAPALAPTADVPNRNRGDVVPVTLRDEKKVFLERNGTVSEFTVPAKGNKIGPAVAFEGRVYINDDDARSVLVFDYEGRQLHEIDVPDANGPLELEVREEHLFINAPNSGSARVIDSKHKVTPINKYPQDVLGSEQTNVSSLLNVPAPKNNGPTTPEQNQNGNRTPTKQSPPGAPGSVTATAGNKSARVIWTSAASNGAAISTYVIEGGGKSKRVSGRSRSVEIDGLDNGTEYTFTVHAVNAKGPGPKGVSNKVRPTAEIPDPPASVTAKENTQGGVTVSWPAADDQGTQIVSYTVTASGGGGNNAFTPTETTQLAIPPGELTLGTDYTFTVVSNTAKNTGSEPSRPSNAVRPYAKPQAPGPVNAVPDGKGTVKVTWTEPPESGRPITAWKVTATGKAQQTITDATQHDLTITGLPDNQNVDVSVRAVNEAGDGAEGTSRAQTPAPPTVTLKGGSSSTTSITVDFSVDNGRSTLEECALQVDGGGRATGSCEKLTVGGLTARTNYSFTVSARNAIGSDTKTGTQSTISVRGIVTCINGTTGDQRTYCNTGIRTFSNSSQTIGTAKREIYYNGRQLEAVCYKRSIGEDPPPEAIDSYVYNGGKKSPWWIRVPDTGSYIPYAWLNLNGSRGPANPGDLGVRAC
jgi:hypothetical protein